MYFVNAKTLFFSAFESTSRHSSALFTEIHVFPVIKTPLSGLSLILISKFEGSIRSCN